MKTQKTKKLKFTDLLLALMVVITISCSDDYQQPAPIFMFKLNAIDEKYSEDYSFDDVEIQIYKTETNWLNEINPIFIGKFDTSGEITIENISLDHGIKYYVDIHTKDRKLSNWGNDIYSINSSSLFIPGQAGENRFIPVGLSPNIGIIGDWEFFNTAYEFDFDKGVIPLKITVTKDFKVLVLNTDENHVEKIINYQICRRINYSTPATARFFSSFILSTKAQVGVTATCESSSVWLGYNMDPIEMITLDGLSTYEYLRE